MQNEKKKCRVIFYATTPQPADQLYLCGEPHNAGNWDAALAKPMKWTDKGWRAIKILPVGEVFEFKILRSRSWQDVEKGIWGEEIANHAIVAQKGLVVEMDIPNFRLD